jgi:hypothetical protein
LNWLMKKLSQVKKSLLQELEIGELYFNIIPTLYHVEDEGWIQIPPKEPFLLLHIEKPEKYENKENIWIVSVLTQTGKRATRGDYSNKLQETFFRMEK